MAYADEQTALSRYAALYGSESVLPVDTYDTLGTGLPGLQGVVDGYAVAIAGLLLAWISLIQLALGIATLALTGWNGTDDPKLAMVDFEQTIRLDPDYAAAYNSRGNAYLNSGLIAFACADFQKACELEDCTYLKWAAKNGNCR